MSNPLPYPNHEDWEDKGKTYGGMGRSLLWWVGDWALVGREMYPDRFDQAVSDAGYEYGTVEDAMRVCRAFPVEERHYGLSYYHHREVAAMPTAEERRSWLERASSGEWSIAQLRRAIRLDREQSIMLLGEVPRNSNDDMDEGVDPDFHIVIANPPWRYINKRINWNLTVPPALPVPDTGGCCFIRANHRHVDQAIRILKKWGYTPRSTYLVEREPTTSIDSSSLEDWRWNIPSRDLVLQGSKGRWRAPSAEDRITQAAGSWDNFCQQVRQQNEWARILHMWPKNPLLFEDDSRVWVWTGVEKEERERRKDAAVTAKEKGEGGTTMDHSKCE